MLARAALNIWQLVMDEGHVDQWVDVLEMKLLASFTEYVMELVSVYVCEGDKRKFDKNLSDLWQWQQLITDISLQVSIWWLALALSTHHYFVINEQS